jgi:hypothetical protein
METWICSRCMEGIYGSLEVVLILASQHKCRLQFDRTAVTTCLGCLRSPTGLCAYHASLLVNLRRPNGTGFLSP